MIPAGFLSPGELSPNVPPGTRAFDMRVSGFAFVENLDAEARQLRPARFAERPWFLTEYPGRVSWTELRQAARTPGLVQRLVWSDRVVVEVVEGIALQSGAFSRTYESAPSKTDPDGSSSALAEERVKPDTAWEGC